MTQSKMLDELGRLCIRLFENIGVGFKPGSYSKYQFMMQLKTPSGISNCSSLKASKSIPWKGISFEYFVDARGFVLGVNYA
jgi:hypothetical protein